MKGSAGATAKRNIGDIRLGNDFLMVNQKLNMISIVDRYGKRLCALDLGKWFIGNSSMEGFFKSDLVEGYYFDWLTQEWVVWRRGVGMPDFSHPAFRQAFKWMLSILIDGRYLNVTFYMTNHDPYIRILINSSYNGLLTTDIEPSPLIRMGLEANVSDYGRRKLLNWNQIDSWLHENPWPPPVWSDTDQGFIGQIFIMEPSSGVEIKKVTNYYQNLNRFIQGHAYIHFNWMENRTENWYSFEFYIRNERDYAQDIILENYVPDDVYRVDVSCSDGDEYIGVGTWNINSFGSTINFIDPPGYSHYFRVHEPVNRGGETRSGLRASEYYGMAKRILMELNLSGGYVMTPMYMVGAN